MTSDDALMTTYGTPEWHAATQVFYVNLATMPVDEARAAVTHVLRRSESAGRLARIHRNRYEFDTFLDHILEAFGTRGGTLPVPARLLDELFLAPRDRRRLFWERIIHKLEQIRYRRATLSRMEDLSPFMASHADLIADVGREATPERQVALLDLLGNLTSDDLTAYTPLLAHTLATANESVGAATMALLPNLPDRGRSIAEELSQEGKPTLRLRAFEYLWSITQGEDDRAGLLSRARATRVASVTAWADAQVAPTVVLPRSGVRPALPVIDWTLKNDPNLAALLARVYLDPPRPFREQEWWETASRQPLPAPSDPSRQDPELSGLLAELAQPGPPRKEMRRLRPRAASVLWLLKYTDVDFRIPAVAVLALGYLVDDPDVRYVSPKRPPFGVINADTVTAMKAVALRSVGLSPLELQAALQDLGDADVAARFFEQFPILDGWGVDTADGVEFFRYNMAQLLGLVPGRHGASQSGLELFNLLRRFPALVTDLESELVGVALGPMHTARRDARRALGDSPAALAAAKSALGDSSASRRQRAAEWLGTLNPAEAVPALTSALAVERTATARAAIEEALARLDG